MTLIKKIYNYYKRLEDVFLYHNAILLVNVFYKNIWNLRSLAIKGGERKRKLYYSYLKHYNSWIGLGATFENIPTFPHDFHGIFISNKAKIGKNVVIFHQVTIGSNSLSDSKNIGSPSIGDNTYIGCGAKIIGNCKIGDNCRIGANCTITKDIPNNRICVMRGLDIMEKENMNNKFTPVSYQ